MKFPKLTLMKKAYLYIFFAFLSACLSVKDNSKILSFQNKWGVSYYFSPRSPGDGCSYQMGFLPLKNMADTTILTDSSSIFDFKYGTGINFLSDHPIFRNQIYAANSKNYIRESGNSSHIVYWAFVKLKYHIDNKIEKLDLGEVSTDTMFLKDHRLPFQFYQLENKIVIDTAYSKKKYVNPWSDPKLRSKMNKYTMPCFIKIL